MILMAMVVRIALEAAVVVIVVAGMVVAGMVVAVAVQVDAFVALVAAIGVAAM